MNTGINKLLKTQGIDGRRREARRFRSLYLQYIRQTQGKHIPLVKQLCSLIVQQDDLTFRQLRGEPNLEIKLTRTASQITYLVRTLNLVANDDGERDRDMREAGLL